VQTSLAPVTVVTTDSAEALECADILMAVVPAFACAFIDEEYTSYLRDGQIVVLNLGRTGGALRFRHILAEMRRPANVLIAETQTFIYPSRSNRPAQVRIFGLKNSVPVAALRGYRTNGIVRALCMAYP